MEYSYIPLLKAAISILKEKGKSQVIAELFMHVETSAPSLLHDFMMEISLAANPKEVPGESCYSIELLENAVKEIELTGTTNLLETPRN